MTSPLLFHALERGDVFFVEIEPSVRNGTLVVYREIREFISRTENKARYLVIEATKGKAVRRPRTYGEPFLEQSIKYVVQRLSDDNQSIGEPIKFECGNHNHEDSMHIPCVLVEKRGG